jgi:hypothetical protein
MKPIPDEQKGFPFIGQVRQDRYWWTNANMQAVLAESVQQYASHNDDQRPPIRFALISCSKSNSLQQLPHENSTPDGFAS